MSKRLRQKQTVHEANQNKKTDKPQQSKLKSPTKPKSSSNKLLKSDSILPRNGLLQDQKPCQQPFTKDHLSEKDTSGFDSKAKRRGKISLRQIPTPIAGSFQKDVFEPLAIIF